MVDLAENLHPRHKIFKERAFPKKRKKRNPFRMKTGDYSMALIVF